VDGCKALFTGRSVQAAGAAAVESWSADEVVCWSADEVLAPRDIVDVDS